MYGSSEIAAVEVYLQKRESRQYVGKLSRKKDIYYFQYDGRYVYGPRSIPLGPDLPLSSKIFKSSTLFPSFEDRIPSRKNPAYNEYCKSVGISPAEKDPLVLVSTLGQKGPSSFIFGSVSEDSFGRQQSIEFRKVLNLSVREFSQVFDVGVATVHRIEAGRARAKDVLKRLEIYYRFPEVALFELERNRFKINDRKRDFAERVLKGKALARKMAT